MITSAHLAEIYARALQTYNREPKDGEFDAWMNVLGQASYSDLDAALRRWQSDTTIEDFTQRPKGARMPTAAELKLSIDKFDRSQNKKFEACGQDGCVDGWIVITSGTIKGRPIPPKDKAVKRCACFWEWAKTQRQ